LLEIEITRISHQTDSLERLNRLLGPAKRLAIVGPDGLWQTAILEELLEGGERQVLAHPFKRLAQQQIA
jgi:hypothetical protein